MMMKLNNIFVSVILLLLLASCEKEIQVNVPSSKEQLVVEASVNQRFNFFNYVFIARSVDYFKPDLSIDGMSGAVVTYTEGRFVGQDTIFDGTVTTLVDVGTVPGLDTLGLSGVYIAPFTFMGKENTPYRLNITMPDGRKVDASTVIPRVIAIDSIHYEIKDSNALSDISFYDGPEQNNYRLAVRKSRDSIMIGWGVADMYRTFDDEQINNTKRTYSFIRTYKQDDTLNFYFSSIGRKEFLFWQSFGQADNGGGNPFSTPVMLKSNVRGAIGSFTGYGISYRQVILK